ncbi:MAG: FtsK/SpoIIIE domain-containing protein [Micrococcales bacterium]|nr:FtsK/SpoIIIE domain-containing protein [Micrococcales bacterium]
MYMYVRALWWLVSRPWRLAGVVAPAGVAWMVHGGRGWLLLLVAALVIGVLIAWRVRWPGSFDRWVTQRVRGAWRGFWVYKRRWYAATGSVGLDGPSSSGSLSREDIARAFPARSAVVSTKGTDRFRVRMLPGQTLDRWTAEIPALCQALGVEDLRLRPVERSRWRRSRLMLDVTAIRTDALAGTAQVPAPDPVVDLAALPVAVAEGGQAWRLPLLGQHVLVGGATGAGKASVLWSIIHALTPAVRTGRVQLWGLDPKALELSYGGGLFYRVVDKADPDAAADLIEDLVRVMDRRKDSMRGVSRRHTPTENEPLIVLLIDELAALTAWAPAPARRRIDTALALLLSQGRAMAISVVGAVQDPRKEVLGLRGLFTIRIGMRLNEAGEVDLLLGSGARARGAVCDQISHSTPGVAWVLGDGDALPVRVRFGWIEDTDIRSMASDYAYVPPTPDDIPSSVGEAA